VESGRKTRKKKRLSDLNVRLLTHDGEGHWKKKKRNGEKGYYDEGKRVGGKKTIPLSYRRGKGGEKEENFIVAKGKKSPPMDRTLGQSWKVKFLQGS